jgi:hypothetical protein
MSDPTVSTHVPTPVWRHFAIPALLALVGYVFFYSCDAHLRERKGPWEVTYAVEADGTPTLQLHQSGLGVSNVLIRFPQERLTPNTTTNTTTSTASLPVTVRFDEPARIVPFGKLAFDDLMYLPGTVVLHCFGHEVQMLPRGLFLDRTEFPWASNSTHDRQPSDKRSDLEPPDPKRRPASTL